MAYLKDLEKVCPLIISLICMLHIDIDFLFVYLSRFGLWPGDHIYGADIDREGQWSGCEAGLSVHSGP